MSSWSRVGLKLKPCMMRHARTVFSLALIGLVFLGAGCVLQPTPKSSDEIKAATDAFLLKQNCDLVLKQTVLGLDGAVVDLLGGQNDDRHINVPDWKPGSRAALVWVTSVKVETQASVDARAAYDAKYKDAPIGTTIPTKPEQSFEYKAHTGTIETNSLASAHSILLPVLWPDGLVGEKKDNSLIWISSAQYDELIAKRKTVLDLGLFDNSIANAYGISDTVHNLINSLKQDATTVKDKEELLSVVADQNFGTFTLMINGKQETVQTIEAHNWFGRYSILSNRNNPLILEASLSPATKGSWNIFSKQKFLDAFAGYKVSEVKIY